MNSDQTVGGWRNSHLGAPRLDRTGVAALVAGPLIAWDVKCWGGPTGVATTQAHRWPQTETAQR
jgi:hypothetical protein